MTEAWRTLQDKAHEARRLMSEYAEDGNISGRDYEAGRCDAYNDAMHIVRDIMLNTNDKDGEQ